VLTQSQRADVLGVAQPTAAVVPKAEFPFEADIQLARKKDERVDQIRAQHFDAVGPDLSFRIDLVLRDRISGQALAVIDVKYKLDDKPSESNIQQVVAYAVELGVSRGHLIYHSGCHTLFKRRSEM
jgi:hypothetical protein